MSSTIAKFSLAAALVAVSGTPVWADSVNSPNITLNVDTNRSTGNGAGNVALTINTITIAEITLPEYSSGAGKAITFKVKPGYQFDPSSNVTAQSATIGLNGAAVNATASVTPTGGADEEITFNLTSGTNTAVQDIIRFNGFKLKILSAAGAAGPAQTTMLVTTSTAGGAFNNQGIVAANIAKGAPDRLVFSAQPGDAQSGDELLPAVTMIDFGGNIITNDNRTIALSLQDNPGAATLNGTLERDTAQGVATWQGGDNLNIATASSGYTLLASHDGAAFLSFDTVESEAFEITAGTPDRLVITKQPVDAAAGGDILVDVTVLDAADNPVSGVSVTLNAAVNPGGWPLLVGSSLTKTTVGGVASWSAADDLRINAATTGYRLIASGAGDPVVTDLFDITAGAPSLLAFVQAPTDTDEDEAIDPAVSVEVIDAFGNRTNTDGTVRMTLSESCSGGLANASAEAVDGLATFTGLTVDAPCEGAVLSASLEEAVGVAGVASDPFDITLEGGSDDGDGGNAGGGCSLVR